jgi:hypothetical protein
MLAEYTALVRPGEGPRAAGVCQPAEAPAVERRGVLAHAAPARRGGGQGGRRGRRGGRRRTTTSTTTRARSSTAPPTRGAPARSPPSRAARSCSSTRCWSSRRPTATRPTGACWRSSRGCGPTSARPSGAIREAREGRRMERPSRAHLHRVRRHQTLAGQPAPVALRADGQGPRAGDAVSRGDERRAAGGGSAGLQQRARGAPRPHPRGHRRGARGRQPPGPLRRPLPLRHPLEPRPHGAAQRPHRPHAPARARGALPLLRAARSGPRTRCSARWSRRWSASRTSSAPSPPS